MKKKTPNIPSETSIATMFAPANEPILKSAEVEHRQPLAQLEPDEDREQDCRAGEEADDLRRAPAVPVAFDQRVAQREERERPR